MDRFVITCVKLGTKYPSFMVNNLYRMCKHNISYPFDFFCYTDDASGLDSAVNVINYINHGLDVIVYNKLFLFSEWMDHQLPSNRRLYFDLDIVIKGNIDDFICVNQNDLTVIDAEWRRKHDYGFPLFHHPFNSSCMVWDSPRTRPFWEHLMKDPEMFMNKFRWGMDSFMFYEKESAFVDVGYFPPRKFYSYMYGVDYEENILHDPDKAFRPSKFVEVVKKIPVILLNGPTTIEDYQRVYTKHYAD